VAGIAAPADEIDVNLINARTNTDIADSAESKLAMNGRGRA
jgi:hypothetical protein